MFRRFQVSYASDYDVQAVTGIINQLQVRTTVVISIRYVWPNRSFDEVQDLAAVDREDIILAIAENPSVYPSADDGEVYAINSQPTPSGLQLRGGNSSALLQIPLDVWYRKDKGVSP